MNAKSVATIAAVLSLSACSPASEAPQSALAGAWTLDSEASRFNFITVKAGQVAEVHHFSGLMGTVAADGAAQVTIDLASVETNVDVRNDRMKEILFDVATFPVATVTANLDPASFSSLLTGQSLVQTVETTVDLHGAQVALPAELTVTRISADRVLVEPTSPIIVSAASFGLDTGVEQLRELAQLDAITGQVPVTFSLTFRPQ